MYKNYTFFVSFMICVVKSVYGDTCTGMDDVRVKIKAQFVNLSTEKIIEARKKEKPVDAAFESFLKEDLQLKSFEHIMRKGTSDAELSVVTFAQDVQHDFAQKGEDLTRELLVAQRNKNIAQICIIFGVGLTLAVFNPDTRPSALFGVAGLAGGIYAYRGSNEKLKTLPEHIKTVHMMEGLWKQTFK